MFKPNFDHLIYSLLIVSLILLLVKHIKNKNSVDGITNIILLVSLLLAWIIQASNLDHFKKFSITFVLAMSILTHTLIIYLEKMPKKETRHSHSNKSRKNGKNLKQQLILELFIGLLLMVNSFMYFFITFLTAKKQTFVF